MSTCNSLQPNLIIEPSKRVHTIYNSDRSRWHTSPPSPRRQHWPPAKLIIANTKIKKRKKKEVKLQRTDTGRNRKLRTGRNTEHRAEWTLPIHPSMWTCKSGLGANPYRHMHSTKATVHPNPPSKLTCRFKLRTTSALTILSSTTCPRTVIHSRFNPFSNGGSTHLWSVQENFASKSNKGSLCTAG